MPLTQTEISKVENTVPSQTQVLDDNIIIESSRSQQFSRSKIQT